MNDNIVIASRFNGPGNSGNGGYVCGVLAKQIKGPCAVTLRAPPPLGKPLALVREADRVRLVDGDLLLAEAHPAPGFALASPPAPSQDEARAAQARAVYGADGRVIARAEALWIEPRNAPIEAP
ncbi:MAG: hypothetical protein K2P58_09255 [Hyphomonadaceae bacterium]|nr:hypothetical protein [Hyphomonadaceae bacterium]